MKTHYVISSRRTALVALIAIVFATPVVRGTPVPQHESIASPSLSFDVNYFAVQSDFDGDHRLDQAELHMAGTHRCIRVRFGNTHETHLDFGSRPHSSGVLMVRDANRDNKPDLIWVYRSRSESAVIWLNDGAGHFAKSSHVSADAILDSLFGDTDYAETGSLENKETCLAPPRPSSEFARVINFDLECLAAVKNARNYFRCDLSRYLSHLRERGPPQPV